MLGLIYNVNLDVDCAKCAYILHKIVLHLTKYQLDKDGCGNDSNVELNDHNKEA